MPEPLRKPSTTLRKASCARAQDAPPCPQAARRLRRNALQACLACLLAALAPLPGMAAEASRPGIGEGYIFSRVAEPAPGAALDSAPGAATRPALEPGLRPDALLDPSSSLWAGAQGLSLSLERAGRLLAANVIANTGDAGAAAASRADGSILLFGLTGTGNCTSVAMPEGHPAYALALAGQAGVLAAWAQGVNRLVFFDLNAPGCPASATQPALRGQVSLTLSASGAFLAAQDESGQIWAGPRGGVLRPLAAVSGAPAALGFSDGEGVLFVLDAQGRGGAWNPRTGKGLRTLEVPGGPFARGDFQGAEARLWTTDGRLVRWDVLHNRPAGPGNQPGEAPRAQNSAWLELRGTDLYATRPGLSWQAQPAYEPHLPQLAVSRHAGCLRLSDVDGAVRYFDAQSGRPRAQCFADDWTEVAVQPDGTARIPGLQLRVFDVLASPATGSRINARALSKTHVVFWTAAAPDLSLRVEAPPLTGGNPLQKVADPLPGSAMQAVSVPLRQGLAADAPALPLLLP